MSPKTKDNYLGVEVECCSPYTYGIILYIAEKYGYKNNVTFNIGYDPSVSNIYEQQQIKYWGDDYGPEDGYELRFLIKQKDVLKETLKMGRFLKEIKAKVTIECGLHVHLDARNVDTSIMIKNLLDNQYQILAASQQRRLRGTYCSPNNETIEMINAGRCDKYKAINFSKLRSYKTIEVRTHEGCVNGGAIYKWCVFLMDIAYKGVLSNESECYIKTRYAV